MTQLIIDGVTLPKSSNDNYRCYPSELATTLDMISGRRIKEVRGFVWKIEWGYDQLDDAVWRQLEKTLRGGGSFPVAFLPDNADAMSSGVFQVESLTPPSFGFAANGRAIWHNLAFTLREVKPHA